MDTKKLDTGELAGISALLIHAAKIDENYTDREKNIILNFLKYFIKENEIIQRIRINIKYRLFNLIIICQYTTFKIS